jgi:hypothetical protein
MRSGHVPASARRARWRLAGVVVLGALSAAVSALAGSATTTMTVTAIVVRGCEVTTTAPAVAIRCASGVRAPRTQQPAPAQPVPRLLPFALGPSSAIAPAASSVGGAVTADGARADGQPSDGEAAAPAAGTSGAGDDAAALASAPDPTADALPERRYRVVTIEF